MRTFYQAGMHGLWGRSWQSTLGRNGDERRTGERSVEKRSCVREKGTANELRERPKGPGDRAGFRFFWIEVGKGGERRGKEGKGRERTLGSACRGTSSMRRRPVGGPPLGFAQEISREGAGRGGAQACRGRRRRFTPRVRAIEANRPPRKTKSNPTIRDELF